MKKVSTPESTSDEDTGYLYHLVEFCQSQQTGLLDVDVVPAAWCFFDRKKDVCMTRYPPPPYNKKVFRELENLVKTRKSPPTGWPSWDIIIKGGADTYERAVERVQKLSKLAYAFTTDGEIDGPTKAAKATAARKKKTTKELFSVADIDCNDEWLKDLQADGVLDNNNNNSRSSTEDEFIRSKRTAVERSPKSKMRAAPSFINHDHRIMCGKKFDGERVVEREKKNGEEDKKDKEKSKQKEGHRENEKKDETVSRCPARAGEKDLSADMIFIVKMLKGLSLDIQANTAAINALHDRLSERGAIGHEKCTVQNLETAHGIQLPFQDKQSFTEFENNLQGDGKLHETLTYSLKQYTDRNNNLTKSLSNILRKFFSQEMAMTFTAKKKIEGKTLLKNTAFGSCLIAAMMKYHTLPDGTPVNEDLVLKSAGAAISNAKDWDGRKGRGKRD